MQNYYNNYSDVFCILQLKGIVWLPTLEEVLSMTNKAIRQDLRLHSDGDPIATYRCKLDGENIKNCELTASYYLFD